MDAALNRHAYKIFEKIFIVESSARLSGEWTPRAPKRRSFFDSSRPAELPPCLNKVKVDVVMEEKDFTDFEDFEKLTVVWSFRIMTHCEALVCSSLTAASVSVRCRCWYGHLRGRGRLTFFSFFKFCFEGA